VAEERGNTVLKGFRQFILRGNVVDLAIAVVIGVAFNAVVQALVRDIITPLIAAIAGKPNFNSLTFTVHHSTFHYGDLVNVVIAFLAIAAAVYFLVVAPLNSLQARRRGPQTDEAEVSEEVQLLTEIRDLLAHSGPTGS
jgi:large conductance mechanosensitive channel